MAVLILHYLLLCLATASISMTLSKAKIFKGLRKLLKRTWPWAGELLACPYCTSHWVALFLVAVANPRLMPGILGWFITSMAVVAGNAVFSRLIHFSYSSMAPPAAEETDDAA